MSKNIERGYQMQSESHEEISLRNDLVFDVSSGNFEKAQKTIDRMKAYYADKNNIGEENKEIQDYVSLKISNPSFEKKIGKENWNDLVSTVESRDWEKAKTILGKIEVIYKEIKYREKFPEESFVVSPGDETSSPEIAIKKMEEMIIKPLPMNYAYAVESMLKETDWNEPLEASYEVVSVYVDELFGDKDRHDYDDIIAKAKEKGFNLVPRRLIPTIFLSDKRKDGYIEIPMKPKYEEGDNSPDIFIVGSGENSYFGASYSSLYRQTYAQLYFVRKQSNSQI